MFTCKKHSKNNYFIIPDFKRLNSLTIPDDCLLTLCIKLMSDKLLTTSTAFTLSKALNIAFEHLDSPTIHQLLLTPSNQLSVHDVIAGYKELEQQIMLASMVKKSTISSAFRSLVSETEFIMADGISIALCRFNTRFKGNGHIHPMSHTPCPSTHLYAIRIQSINTSSAYWIIDPDSLIGILQPGGLLDIGLRRAETESMSSALYDEFPQSWLLTLQAIAFAANNEYIKYLFNSKPDSLDAKDVLRGITQLEDILEEYDIRSATKKSKSLRNLLTLGGKIGSGVTVNDCEFNSRFLYKDKKIHQEFRIELDDYVAIKISYEKSIRYCYLKTFPLTEDSILNTSLKNLSLYSENTPFLHSKFIQLRLALRSLSDEVNLEKECPFLTGHAEDLSAEKIIQDFTAIHGILDKYAYGTTHLEIKELKELIFKHGEVDITILNSLNEKEPQESAVIIDATSDVISDFITPNGLLQTCFSTSQWDALTTQSQSTENYGTRVSLSKLLSYLIDCKDIPHTRFLLRSQPADITPIDIYSCYTEVESILYKSNCTISVATFINFLERNAGKISGGLPFKCISVSRFPIKDNKVLYTPERNFTLQKVVGKNITRNLLPFGPDRLSGIMQPGTLVWECLKASENQPMAWQTARILRVQLHNISKAGRSSIKSLLSCNKNDLTVPMIIDGLTEFESMVEHDSKLQGISQKDSSNAFVNFLIKWMGEVVPNLFDPLSFTSRFSSNNGQVKCIEPFSIEGLTNDGKNISINFNTYLHPDFYKPDGLLSASLLAAKQQVEQHSSAKLLQWSVLIEHILENEPRLPADSRIKYFLSSPLASSNRTRAMIAFKSFVNLIELIDAGDKESYFYALIELFSLNDDGKIKDGRSLSELNFNCPFSPINEKQIIQFNVKSTLNSKVKHGKINFDISILGRLNVNHGLLITSLQTAAKKYQINPITSSTISSVIQIVSMINSALSGAIVSIENFNKNIPLRHLLTSPAELLSLSDVKVGLERLEGIIEESQFNEKGSLSGKFRSFLSQNSDTISNGLKISECGFKTRFPKKVVGSGIKLIIPLDKKTGQPLPSPIKIKANSIEEMKKNINEYYQKPITEIINKAEEEIKRYKKLIKEFSPMIERNDNGEFTFNIPKQLQRHVLQLSTAHESSNRKLTKLIIKFGKKNVLAAFLQLRADTPANQTIYCAGKSILIPDDYSVWFGGGHGNRMKPFFWSPFLLPKDILLVCFIRLIIHTTWNKSVIAALRGKDIPYPLPVGRFFLKGYKNKVGKTTTEVEITPSDHEVREVIELLGIHYHNMLEIGFTPETVWDTPDSDMLSFLSNNVLSNFIERHNLPKFTFEQLAKHQINVRKGVDGSIHRSQIERNHAQLQTTAGYVDHPIARIYYEANNAEFQRRLEATVIFRHFGAESLQEYGLSNSDIDLKLLSEPREEKDLPHWFLLPDGSTCTDIWAPIDKHSKTQRVCSGRKCHSDDGCPHNRVIISINDFVNTLRYQQWFIGRCEALLLKHTREYFDEYIAPEMRFTFGLARYVETANPEMYMESKKILASTQAGDE